MTREKAVWLGGAACWVLGVAAGALAYSLGANVNVMHSITFGNLAACVWFLAMTAVNLSRR